MGERRVSPRSQAPRTALRRRRRPTRQRRQQEAQLTIRLRRITHRALDLLAQQRPVALAQPVHRDLDRGLGHTQLRRHLAIARFVAIAGQVPGETRGTLGMGRALDLGS